VDVKKENLSIIIPTYNKLPRLKLMLASLSQVSNIENTEVIIVNDGSTDATLQFLDNYAKDDSMDLRIINVKNAGRSAARNIGVKNASNERIIFCDDDMILDRNFVKEHIRYLDLSERNVVHGFIYSLSYLKFFSDPENGVLFKEYESEKEKSGLMKFCITSDDIRNNFYKVKDQRRTTKFEKDIQQLFVVEEQVQYSKYTWVSSNGGNLSMYKDMFFRAGTFDENMGKIWGVEDLELGYRLYRNEAKFCFAEKAINYHMAHIRENAKDIHNEAFGYFRNKYHDELIENLQFYFDGCIHNLVEWRGICEDEN
jgi:glycosyltransferase involved in cell wall biosynthesis